MNYVESRFKEKKQKKLRHNACNKTSANNYDQ